MKPFIKISGYQQSGKSTAALQLADARGRGLVILPGAHYARDAERRFLRNRLSIEAVQNLEFIAAQQFDLISAKMPSMQTVVIDCHRFSISEPLQTLLMNIVEKRSDDCLLVVVSDR